MRRARNGLPKGLHDALSSARRNQLGWYQNAEVDKLGAEVMQTFDDVEQTKILQRLHEIAVEEAARIFIVHDLNPRALSPRVVGFVQARSWYQDLTPIVVTSPPN